MAPKIKKHTEKVTLFEHRQLLWNGYGILQGEFCQSEFIICLLKQFILKNKESAKTLFNFLSFVVGLPTSEAIVENWGSSIYHLFKIKPNAKEDLSRKILGQWKSWPSQDLIDHLLEFTKVHWLWCIKETRLCFSFFTYW